MKKDRKQGLEGVVNEAVRGPEDVGEDNIAGDKRDGIERRAKRKRITTLHLGQDGRIETTTSDGAMEGRLSETQQR